ncbi:STAS domain-containing protein [Candidatus Uabimicrobium amorphum]|uniref:Anti-sigma factor antagonist n=1 Tax=Uabimicrobium amorphum TaxID=2596890 RepID=A0A5S9IJP2_UABAM|nr:STAS domain-containing protein [Candidatus Uabimicrobium amorphum]BBM83098.1 anti-sigma factor antagonist [Candidatus Uabimicrobium amorphum]
MKKTNLQFHRFSLSSEKNIVFVFVLGAINKHTVQPIQQFSSSLEEEDSIIILDLQEVHYIDSTGLGILATFQQQCEETDVQLKMCRVSQKIHHLFKMLGMTSCFAIFDTEEDVFAELENNGVLREPVKYYLQKTQQLKIPKNNEAPEPQPQPKLTKSVKATPKKTAAKSEDVKTAFLKVVYDSSLTIKKEYGIEISMTDCLERKWQIVPHIKGCIVQPPFFYLHDRCKKVYFSIVPMVKNTSTFLNVDVFGEKHQRISRPIRIMTYAREKNTLEYTTGLQEK